MSGIFFPRMHPSLAPDHCPFWVHFMSPGLPSAADRYPRFRPPSLPMSEQESIRYARQVTDFVNQFRKPQELAGLLGPELDHIPLYHQSGLAIREDLRAHLGTKTGQKNQDRQKKFRLQGQMNLIMAWIIEERAIELQGLNENIHSFQQVMDEVLGIEGRPPDMWGQGSMGNTTLQLVPWTKLLPWFLLFLGPQEALVVQDPEIIEQWNESGLSLEPTRPIDHEDLLLETDSDASRLLTTICTGTQLLNISKAESDLPGMDGHVRIFCLTQEEA